MQETTKPMVMFVEGFDKNDPHKITVSDDKWNTAVQNDEFRKLNIRNELIVYDAAENIDVLENQILDENPDGCYIVLDNLPADKMFTIAAWCFIINASHANTYRNAQRYIPVVCSDKDQLALTEISPYVQGEHFMAY